MKILLINNEKNGLESEWIRLLHDRLTDLGEAEVDILSHEAIAEETSYDSVYDCLVLSGREITWNIGTIASEYDKELRLIPKMSIPILGICAGCQLIGVAHGAVLGRMIEGEDGVQEEGFVDLQMTMDDAIFTGTQNPCVCYAYHGDELKSVPQDFVLLARSTKCGIHSIRHKKKKIYGFQAHPEKYDNAHEDGKILIRNFFNIMYT